MKWQPIETIPMGREGDQQVLLYNPNLDADPDFPGHPYTVSNPVYASSPKAVAAGYTLWLRIPEPPNDQ